MPRKRGARIPVPGATIAFIAEAAANEHASNSTHLLRLRISQNRLSEIMMRIANKADGVRPANYSDKRLAIRAYDGAASRSENTVELVSERANLPYKC